MGGRRGFGVGLFSALAAVLAASALCLAAERMPGPNPAALWRHITKADPYEKWDQWPDHQGMREGNAPHGPLHRVFGNAKALGSTTLPAAEGSILVKENYTARREMSGLTVMYKVKGYNPAAGDWFWVRYSPDGSAVTFGKPSGCISCHSLREDNDFILTHEFR